jgi:hypothetical protein
LASAIGIGLAALNAYDPGVWPSIQIFDRQTDELGSPQRAEEADQQQGAVPNCCEVGGKRGDDPGQHVYIEGRGSVSASTVYPADSPEDLADQGVLGRIGMAEGLVGVGNCCETASQRCGGQRV